MEPTEKRTARMKQRRNVVHEPEVPDVDLDVQMWDELPDEKLAQSDELGWAPIHHAARKGVLHIIERAVLYNNQLLEQKTIDVSAITPLLIAVQTGNLEAVRGLTELNARLDAADARGQGIVEMSSARRDCNILAYYARLDNERLHVWKRIVKLMKSDFEEESEPAAWCAHQLTLIFEDVNEELAEDSETNDEDREGGLNWHGAFKGGIVSGVTHVLKSTESKTILLLAFNILFIMIERPEVRAQCIVTGLIPVLANLLSTADIEMVIITHSAKILTKLAGSRGFQEDIQKHAVYAALVCAVKNAQSYDVLTEIVDAMGKVVNDNVAIRTAFGLTPDGFQTLVGMYDRQDAPDSFLSTLSTAVSRLAAGHRENQKQFVKAGILPRLVELGRDERRISGDIRLTAVTAFLNLVNGNRETQSVVLEAGLTQPLWAVVQKSSDISVKENAASALWTATQADVDERQRVAELMGPSTFSQFLATAVTSSDKSAISSELLVIGAEGIETLSLRVHQPEAELQPPAESIITRLVQLLAADNMAPRVMVAALRALGTLCVGLGYAPRLVNQRTVSDAGGLVRLLELSTCDETVDDDDDDDDDTALVRVEASLAFALVQIGNSEIRSELTRILHGGQFDFSLLVGYLHDESRDSKVRWRAGAALAAFSYNSISNQRQIAECASRTHGGILYGDFTDFLSPSQDDIVRCWTAYQVTILCPLFVDKSPAFASVEGIKTLVNCLSSNSDAVIALAVDCIARLSHTRAGIPGAFTAVSAVQQLCELLTSRVEQIRSGASVALGYLSFDPEARRRLLNCCRLKPSLLQTISYYANVGGKLSPKLLNDWKHYEHVGFPAE